jgi:cyclopropane-fatty-acyl-phospholipid synthase
MGMTVITSTSGQAGLPRWFSASFELLKGLQAGSLDIVLPDGRTFRAEGAGPGPAARLEVRDPGLFARVAREGELGFCEAYLDGWWETPDLQALLDVLLSSRSWVRRAHPAAALVRACERMRHWLNRNSRDQAARNIAHHYDLGNAFYSRWLDETMTYSSALFEAPSEELAAAQRRKYARIGDRIGAAPGRHILEIGCGWGGFAEFAARERGARVTALRDYRDERGSYDGIASIEMFEAVGERYWPTYFAAVRDRLRPGAQATLQVITVSDTLFPTYRRTVDFIQKYIFPGGMLPSPSALSDQIERAGLRLQGSMEFGQSYSETLRRWHGRFEDAWGEIQALGFDERFRRMWSFYLTSCAAAFRTGTTDVTQVTLQRPA